MSPLKNDPVTTLLTLLRDPEAGADARVAAATLILETVLEEELKEVKRRLVALEARQKQRRPQ